MNNQNYNLLGAIDANVDSGVASGQDLVRFAGALVGSDVDELKAAREVLADSLGSAAIVTASIIGANFSMLDRIANAIGISADTMMMKPSADIRELLGINAYPSAANSLT